MTWSEEAHKQLTTPIVLMEIVLDDETLYLSKTNIEVPGQGFYEGRVLTFGTVHREVSNTDGQFVISDITTLVTNADGKFKSTDLQKMLNRSVIYRVGFEGQDIADFKKFFQGKIANFKFKNYEFEIVTTDATKLWLENDYGHTLVAADWPDAMPGISGKKMPIIYGELTGNIF